MNSNRRWCVVGGAGGGKGSAGPVIYLVVTGGITWSPVPAHILHHCLTPVMDRLLIRCELQLRHLSDV